MFEFDWVCFALGFSVGSFIMVIIVILVDAITEKYDE